MEVRLSTVTKFVAFLESPSSSSSHLKLPVAPFIPLRLAYACTFTKCQRLTLARTIVDLSSPPFARGQFYTAHHECVPVVIAYYSQPSYQVTILFIDLYCCKLHSRSSALSERFACTSSWWANTLRQCIRVTQVYQAGTNSHGVCSIERWQRTEPGSLRSEAEIWLAHCSLDYWFLWAWAARLPINQSMRHTLGDHTCDSHYRVMPAYRNNQDNSL